MIGQKFLSIAFIAFALLGMWGISWAVDGEPATETLQSSGDTTEFLDSFQIPFSGQPYITTTGEYWILSGETYGQNYTPVYVGNQTWSYASDGIPSDTYDRTEVKFCADISEAVELGFIQEINYSLKHSADIDQYSVFVLFLNGKEDYIGSGENYINLVADELTDGSEWTNYTMEVSDFKALDINQRSPDWTSAYLLFSLRDTDNDGIGANDYSMKFTIEGEPQDSFNTEQKLIGVFLVAGSINIIIAIFATDSVDLDKVLKSLGVKA